MVYLHTQGKYEEGIIIQISLFPVKNDDEFSFLNIFLKYANWTVDFLQSFYHEEL